MTLHASTEAPPRPIEDDLSFEMAAPRSIRSLQKRFLAERRKSRADRKNINDWNLASDVDVKVVRHARLPSAVATRFLP